MQIHCFVFVLKDLILYTRLQSLRRSAFGFSGREVVLILSLLFLIIYFAGQFFVGLNGWISYKKLIRIKEEKLLILNKVENQNERYRKELMLIAGPNVDLDYLDEIARRKLGGSGVGEKIIVY